MHPSNIMWYLNELDNNSQVKIEVERSKHYDNITITTDKFEFDIDEYGRHGVCINNKWSEFYDDMGILKLVEEWVKSYMNEVL